MIYTLISRMKKSSNLFNQLYLYSSEDKNIVCFSLCMYFMYVCIVCMYCVDVLYVCIVCMYVYVFIYLL